MSSASNQTANMSGSQTRPIKRRKLQRLADINPLEIEAGTFDEFLDGIGTIVHQLRIFIMLTSGIAGRGMQPHQVEILLHWTDLLSMIDRESDRMLDDVTKGRE